MMPERIIRDLIELGVNTITGTTGLLDNILTTISAAELAKAKTVFANNPPEVVMGYAREGLSMPSYAITMTDETIMQDYLAVGEEYMDATGNRYVRRVKGAFTIFVYSDHPDVCVWAHRVLRRICEVGIPYLIDAGLDDPVLSGADLVPDPRYTPHNAYVRRLTITVEYEDEWDDTDALWTAINGAQTATGSSIGIAHEDAGGGIEPVED